MVDAVTPPGFSLPSTPVWGLHNADPEIDFLDGGFVSVGWSRVGDLREIGADRDAIKFELAALYPDVKPAAIPVWAGMLLRFGFEMHEGDLLVYPHKPDSTVSIGAVRGGYRWEGTCPPNNRHRRSVRWLRSGIPRAALSPGARGEISSAMTLFRIRRHSREFTTLLDEGSLVDRP